MKILKQSHEPDHIPENQKESLVTETWELGVEVRIQRDFEYGHGHGCAEIAGIVQSWS